MTPSASKYPPNVKREILFAKESEKVPSDASTKVQQPACCLQAATGEVNICPIICCPLSFFGAEMLACKCYNPVDLFFQVRYVLHWPSSFRFTSSQQVLG